jgi:tetratricopeptide (TPR) repeat protein
MKTAGRFSLGRCFIIVRRRNPALALLALCLSCSPFSVAAASPSEQNREYTSLWSHGDYREALQTLETLIKERGDPIPLRWLVDRAELRYETGRIDEAIADLENLEKIRYASPVHLLRLALLYRERGRKDDYLQTRGRAVERALQTIRYSPRPELMLVLGRIGELQGDNPKTILNSLYASLMEQAPDYAPGFVAAGDLACRKWDYQLAAEYYEKALKIQKENQDALAGLAECYWKSSDPRLEECLERLLALNPNHPRARAMQVEMALDIGKTEAALRIIDEALAVNPNRMEMLALQSAAWFLMDSPTSMAATQRRAGELNPQASDVLRVTARIASRHYRFREAVEFERRALEIDPDDSLARAYYAFDLLRLGDAEEGRRQLEQAFKTDRYNVTVFNMLNLLDTLQRFETIERGPFVLQLPRKEAAILANDALALLGEAYAAYTRKYEVELEKPVRVQVFDNHDDFMVRSVGLPGSAGHLGICFGQLVTMDSPSARSKWEANWRSVLWHEFVHVVTLQKTKNRAPRWLSEGMSVYEEAQRDKAWGQRLNVQYKAIVEHEPLPGLAEMESYFISPKTPAHLMFGYVAAGQFVHFYTDRFGFAALTKTLNRIGSGQAAEVALAESASVSRETLDREFRTYLKKCLVPFDNLPSAPAPKNRKPGLSDRGASITLTQTEWIERASPFTDAMRAAREALQSEDWDKAEAALKRAQELFPDYSGADAPSRQLIALYERQKRGDDLRAALRRQIGWNATDFPSCRKLVALLEEDRASSEIIQIAERAFAIDPFDVGMRRSALEAYRKIRDKAKVLATLDQMLRLDPTHTIDYQLQRIETLCDLERWTEAKKETIQLLEETPYYWEAQKLLLRIVERDAGSQAGQVSSSSGEAGESLQGGRK